LSIHEKEILHESAAAGLTAGVRWLHPVGEVDESFGKRSEGVARLLGDVSGSRAVAGLAGGGGKKVSGLFVVLLWAAVCRLLHCSAVIALWPLLLGSVLAAGFSG